MIRKTVNSCPSASSSLAISGSGGSCGVTARIYPGALAARPYPGHIATAFQPSRSSPVLADGEHAGPLILILGLRLHTDVFFTAGRESLSGGVLPPAWKRLRTRNRRQGEVRRRPFGPQCCQIPGTWTPQKRQNVPPTYPSSSACPCGRHVRDPAWLVRLRVRRRRSSSAVVSALAALQAGGHRFDPGTLQRESPAQGLFSCPGMFARSPMCTGCGTHYLGRDGLSKDLGASLRARRPRDRLDLGGKGEREGARSDALSCRC